ncbi:MAG: hypothetical protein GX050_00530, partial [Firmicutes bacterium]|nr:hypothetical protein [Bacillota bacterium]
IQNCVVYHGHGGFVVGSEMSGGIRNVYVRDCTFINTDVGLRFKSTRGRGGVVEKIYIERINMLDIERAAISVSLFYEQKQRHKQEAVPVTEETPVFRDIHFKEVVCRGAEKAVVLEGLPEMPLSKITMEKVSISAEEGLFCSEVEDSTLKQVEFFPQRGPVLTVVNSRNVTIETGVYPEENRRLLRVEGKRCSRIRLLGPGGKELREELESGAEVPAEV